MIAMMIIRITTMTIERLAAEVIERGKKQEPDASPALLVTRFIRPHPGVQKDGAVFWALSDRTAGKTPMPTLQTTNFPTWHYGY